MLAALERLRGELGGQVAFDIEVVDVDADPALARRYDEWVPVLEIGGEELCHYFLDEAKVREVLGRFG